MTCFALALTPRSSEEVYLKFLLWAGMARMLCYPVLWLLPKTVFSSTLKTMYRNVLGRPYFQGGGTHTLKAPRFFMDSLFPAEDGLEPRSMKHVFLDSCFSHQKC